MRKLVKKGTALTSAVLMLVGSMPVTAVNVLASESIGNQIAVQAEQSLSVQADGQTESGIWGTCEWTYEDGVLTIGGGVGESGITWWNYRNDIKKIIINGRITFPEGTSLNSLFYKMNVLETIEGLDNLDTSGVTDMSWMFYYCSLLESIDVSKFNTSSVTDMSWMFDGCSSLENIDVSKFNTSNVTNMSCMFSGCSSLESIDVSKFNTSSVMRMYGMFMGCSSLKSIDVSKFNTSKVTDMPCMFDGCSSLKSIDVSKFNTSKVTDMSWMFYGCSSLKNIDVSNFNTFNVTNMSYMFQNCSSLQNLDLSGFNMNCGSFDEMFDNDNLLSIKMPAEFGKNKERFLDALVLGMPEGKWTDDTTGTSYNNIASVELLEGHSYKFNPEKMNVDFTTRYNTRGIILKANVEGGAPQYKYKFIMYNPYNNKWTLISDYSKYDAYILNMTGFGNRIIYVDVKDALGNVVRASRTITLVGQKPLAVEVSENETDKQVTFSANAAGGSSEYTYKFIVYNRTTGTWGVVQNYSDKNTCTWTKGSAGEREFYVDVKDSDGNVVRSKAVNLTIGGKGALSVKTTVSANMTKPGDKVTFTMQGTGGKAGYTYKMVVYNKTTKTWGLVQNFNANNKITWTAGSAGDREFYIDVKDSAGNVVRSSVMNVKTGN
jgi:surface protein|uniref:BspA family leucine-rich repeat surface protein n=3 Tax=Lachnospira eligens TaxID=39485 RepID=UPI0040255B9F